MSSPSIMWRLISGFLHDDPMGHEVLWPEGTGEWEIIKKGNPRFEGHYQPKYLCGDTSWTMILK